jgi:hypothetical protein
MRVSSVFPVSWKDEQRTAVTISRYDDKLTASRRPTLAVGSDQRCMSPSATTQSTIWEAAARPPKAAQVLGYTTNVSTPSIISDHISPHSSEASIIFSPIRPLPEVGAKTELVGKTQSTVCRNTSLQ